MILMIHIFQLYPLPHDPHLPTISSSTRSSSSYDLHDPHLPTISSSTRSSSSYDPHDPHLPTISSSTRSSSSYDPRDPHLPTTSSSTWSSSSLTSSISHPHPQSPLLPCKPHRIYNIYWNLPFKDLYNSIRVVTGDSFLGYNLTKRARKGFKNMFLMIFSRLEYPRKIWKSRHRSRHTTSHHILFYPSTVILPLSLPQLKSRKTPFRSHGTGPKMCENVTSTGAIWKRFLNGARW